MPKINYTVVSNIAKLKILQKNKYNWQFLFIKYFIVV